MAHLVSFKTCDENHYSTFDGEPNYNSRENLTDSNRRVRLLPKKKSKLQKLKMKMAKDPNSINQMPETIPTISASIELHRNKIAQSQAMHASSGEITRGRRRPANHYGHPAATQSQHTCSPNGKLNSRKRNCPSNQQQQQSADRGKHRCKSCCCFARWWKWCFKRKCCARFCCGCIDYEDSENDDDDDDDIDAKFEQYKHEIRLNELKRNERDSNRNCTGDEMQETSLQSNSYRIELSPSSSLSTVTTTTASVTPTVSYNHHRNSTANEGNAINIEIAALDKTSKPTSIISRYRKYWNWNDSLRSNSDKFLETLEYDMDGGEQSLKRTNNKHHRTDASARTKGYMPDLPVACSSHTSNDSANS